MKVITFYSDSHKDLYNTFVSSFNEHLSSKYTLLTKKIEQLSPSGEYNSNGFDLSMLEKLTWIIDNIDVNDTSPMVFSDCDVQFFGDLDFDISEYDILFQHDYHNNFNYSWFPGEKNRLGKYPSYCAGFFICKQSEKVKKFFQDVKDNLIKNLNGTLHDQTMMNKMIGKLEGADVWLVISLMVFLLFFTAVCVYLFRMSRRHAQEMSMVPLSDDSTEIDLNPLKKL